MSTGYLTAAVAACVFAFLYSPVVGFITRRRLGTSWRYFGYGALVFVVFQVLTRIPAIQLAQASLGTQLQESQTLLWGWLIFLAFTAGLFEEVGRFVGYRLLMRREEKTWSKAVMFGVGHGGIEAILLSGVVAAITIANLVALSAGGLEQIPPEQRELAARQLAAIGAQPDWFPLLGAWERLWTLPIHVGLSVMVLQVFTRGSLRWLWLAIGAHALVDLAAVGLIQVLGQSTTSTLIVEACLAGFGAAGLWIIWRLRPSSGASAAALNG